MPTAAAGDLTLTESARAGDLPETMTMSAKTTAAIVAQFRIRVINTTARAFGLSNRSGRA
jgi:hypothetical protein